MRDLNYKKTVHKLTIKNTWLREDKLGVTLYCAKTNRFLVQIEQGSIKAFKHDEFKRGDTMHKALARYANTLEEEFFD